MKPFVSAVVLIELCSGLTLSTEKKVILPKGAEPNAVWSYGILVDGKLYVTTYKACFKDPKPARATVVVSRLVGASHVEITA